MLTKRAFLDYDKVGPCKFGETEVEEISQGMLRSIRTTSSLLACKFHDLVFSHLSSKWFFLRYHNGYYFTQSRVWDAYCGHLVDPVVDVDGVLDAC